MIGLVGAGSMARALARGWGDPVLCTDRGSGRAAALVAEVGGEVVSSNRELAERADVVVLCHKPRQLDEVAREIGGHASLVVSILSGVTLDELRRAYPATPVARVAVNLPVEARAGVVCVAGHAGLDDEQVAAVTATFGRLGAVIPIPEPALTSAVGLSGVGPAYLALVVEAQVDAAIGAGVPHELAERLALQTLTGTAELLRARGMDTLGLRRGVASPGGVTARGLAALEGAGLRAAFLAAADATRPEPAMAGRG